MQGFLLLKFLGKRIRFGLGQASSDPLGRGGLLWRVLSSRRQGSPYGLQPRIKGGVFAVHPFRSSECMPTPTGWAYNFRQFSR